MIDCQKIKDISENLMRRFGQERCEAGKCRGEEDCVVKRILEKMRREPIGYMVYLAALFAILFVGISDLNPGHIYIGPSGRERYNCSGGNAVSRDQDWEGTFTAQKDMLWGVSLRLSLSQQDREKNATRSTRESAGIVKNAENASVIEAGEEIEVLLTAEEEVIGRWYFPVGDVRPSTDLKLVFSESRHGLSGGEITVNVRTGLSGERAFEVRNLAPIYGRIPAEGVRGMMLAAACFVLLVCAAAGKYMAYHKAWLLLGSIFAALWIVVIPYARVPDEEAHFFRIYEITEGHMFSDVRETMEGEDIGRLMPGNLDVATKEHAATWRDIIDHRNLNVDRDAEVWYSFPNMALYSPVSYLPQTIGVWLGKLFTDRVLVMIYLGRLAGAGLSLVLIYWALKMVPVKKECLFLVAMLPMYFQELVSLSADSLINALAIFFTAFSFRLIAEKRDRKITKGETIALWMLAPAISLCKAVYLPLCAMYFMIPERLFRSRRQRIACTVGPVAAATAADAGWMLAGKVGSSASGEQIAYILRYPFEFVKIVYRTIMQYGDEVIFEMLGSNMGGLNIEVDETPLLILACVIVVLAVSRPENGIRFSTAQKIFFLCLCAVIISMTWGSMYLLYNEVGNNLITGFQGRYLFPMMLLLLAGLENRNFVRKTGALNRWLYPLAGSINLYVLLLVAEEMSW